jgi:hypothetical protein
MVDKMRKIICIPRSLIIECQGELRLLKHEGVELEVWWDELKDCLCVAELEKEEVVEDESTINGRIDTISEDKRTA